MEHSITIDMVRGGFVVDYPVLQDDGSLLHVREVFVNYRKLQSRLKEVVESFSTVDASAA
jgi:hypothetical protein